ncbi:MAG: hypothetical protein IJ776_03385 [Paludibacteraceae bacterium]|nr:hypothetical protein [Paludibacteraceae bacterium]
MKKITFILSAVLVSLSVLAAPVTTLSQKEISAVKKVEAKAVNNFQQVAFDQQMSRIDNVKQFDAVNLTSFQSKEVAQLDVNAVKKIVQQVAEDSVVVNKTKLGAIEAGVGVAAFGMQPGDSAVITGKYYRVEILNANFQPIALTRSFFPMATITQVFNTYFSSSARFINFCKTTNSQTGSTFGQVISALSQTNYLPTGTYYFALEGYPLDSTGTYVDTSSEDTDIAAAGFQLILTGEEYAVTDIKVTTETTGATTIAWEVANEIPEGAVYEISVSLADSDIVDVDGLTVKTYTIPDSLKLTDNATYYTSVTVWSPYGYSLGNRGYKYFTLGTNPDEPTNLAAVPDNENMNAALSWECTLGAQSYYIVSIYGEDGTEYTVSTGYFYATGLSATTQQLPVGKYTWTVQSTKLSGNTLYGISDKIQGPVFEIKDGVAPEIDSVYLANVTDTLVNLGIVVTDNNPYLTPADLVYSVSGDYTLANASLEADGTLKLVGLTSKLYNIKITAADPSGNVSDEYEFAFTPIKDEEAPKNLKAEIEEGNVFDKYVIITVSAEDNIATAEQLTYVLTFADGSVVEMKAQEGYLILEGLTPETDYTVTVTVKDFGGNVSTESVTLIFTTIELQPISLNNGVDAWFAVYSDEYSEEGWYNYNIAFQGTSANKYLPYGGLDIYTPRKDSLTGVYSQELGNLEDNYCYINVDGQRLTVNNTVLEIKFIQNYDYQGNVYDYYNIYLINLQLEASDGNIYTYKAYDFMRSYDDATSDNIAMMGFTDTDAPELWDDESYEPEVNGTTVEIMFGVYDGPFYMDIMTYWASNGQTQQYLPTEIYSEISNLTLEVVDATGNVLASQAEGSIKNTPTLDEDGAYYFTATLTGLEANTEYLVYITAADEAGNEAEPIEVTFTTGEHTGINDINVNDDAKKFIRDGHLYIKRGTEIYNATGIRVAK